MRTYSVLLASDPELLARTLASERSVMNRAG